MKSRAAIVAVVFSLSLGAVAVAQEHWTEGPVWSIQFYRTTPGHFDDYLKYIRQNYVPQTDEGKKAGLILDYKVFVKTPSNPQDWDIAFATLYKNMGALDFSAENDKKNKAIAEKHYKTGDEDKQQDMIKPRFEWRTPVGSDLVREVTLKPMPMK